MGERELTPASYADAESLQQTFLDRWLRRGLLVGLATGFTLPYFRLLNQVQVQGRDILTRLPRKNVVFLANHQTYFMEAIAFFDLVYVRMQMPMESPMLRFSAAKETMEKNVMTRLLAKAGGITFRRSFREGGVEVTRTVDLEGVAKVEQAISEGWLLHFPAGTTQRGAPLRSGIAQILHRTKATAVPVRVDGFRQLLVHKQIPGKLFKQCRITIHPPLELTDFYGKPYHKEEGRAVVAQLTELLKEPD